MSQNTNETTRHLKFCYISVLTNLLRTGLPIYLPVRRRVVRIEI